MSYTKSVNFGSGNNGFKTSKADKGKSGNNGSKANKTGENVKMDEKSATSGGGTGGTNVMTHRNIPIQYPMLTDTNYGVWVVKMKIILRTLRVWQAVTNNDVDEECNEGAMVAIAQSIPDSMLMTLAEFEMAREAWNALQEMRIGEDRVTKARAQVLKRQFHKLQMEETESVNDYAMRLTTLVGEIRALGAKLDEVEVVEKFFSSVTDKFTYIIGTLEQITDIEDMTITEAIGRLRTWEENSRGCRRGQGGGGDQLMYSRADWEAPRSKGKRDGEESSDSDNDGHHVKGKEKGKSHGHGKGDQSNEQRPRNLDMSKVKCYNCNTMGHFAKQCPEPNKRDLRANLVKYEDDDPTLLMAKVCDLTQTVVVKPNRKVVLQEKKVTPKLSGNEDTSNQGDRGDHDHHDADTDDDMSEDLGNDAADEALHGDQNHNEAQSDNDRNDDGHGHDDYAGDTDANDPTPSMPSYSPSSSIASTSTQFVSPNVEEPTNFVEASNEPSWKHAMDEEMKAIESNNTWSLVTRLPSHKPLGLKWVYKLKKDTKGVVVKHKARLVAKGYVQRKELIMRRCLHRLLNSRS